MGNSILPPLPPADFLVDVLPPEFVDLTLSTLGNLGDVTDGFDGVFTDVVIHHATHGSLIKAIRHCFEKSVTPWQNFTAPAETLIDGDLELFLPAGDQLVSDFVDLGSAPVAGPAVAALPPPPPAPRVGAGSPPGGRLAGPPSPAAGLPPRA